MKVGDKFNSYEQFVAALEVYKNHVNNEFWIRDARTLNNQKNRFPESLENVNETLKYYYIRLACIKGGRKFKSKNEHSKRLCTTFKQNCEASIFVRLTPCKQYLYIKEINENHNHTSSKTYFSALHQQRLKIPESLKIQARESLQTGANKKLVLDKIRKETGCKITLKDLTNIARKGTEKSTFQECIYLLKYTYNCEVDIFVDDKDMFKGLYFQDTRMKIYFSEFPEIIFVDGTYCLQELKTATYIIMIEDGNASSEIVAVCLLVEENEESLDFFIETFKKYNPTWTKIEVVMSDKDKTERKVFSKHFPNSSLIICLFHVFQIFNREISTKKMEISSDEVAKCKTYLQKIAYSTSEKEYEEIYREMALNIPDKVKQYFDVHWAPIKEQWVHYFTWQKFSCLNKTNNRLESINAKLKSVITRYSPLEDFIKNFFIVLDSMRTQKDVQNSHMINKIPVKQYESGSPEYLFSQYLTTFAFKQVENQLKLAKSYVKEFQDMGSNTFIVVTTHGLIQITTTDCECLFRKATHLPCKHIFKCRLIMQKSLFDESLCARRWTRSLCEEVLQKSALDRPHNIDINEENNSFSLTRSNVEKYRETRPLSNHKKFKLMCDEGRKLAQLCSEVSSAIFYKRLNVIKQINKIWNEGKDELLNECLKTIIKETDKTYTINTEIEEEIFHITQDNPLTLENETPATEENVIVELLENNDGNQINTDMVLYENTNSYQTHIAEKICENGENINTENYSFDTTELTEKLIVLEPKMILEHSETEKISILQKNDDNNNNDNCLNEDNDDDDDPISENCSPLPAITQGLSEDLLLQRIRMPTGKRPRGRPRGCGNTVIGLKKKRQKK